MLAPSTNSSQTTPTNNPLRGPTPFFKWETMVDFKKLTEEQKRLARKVVTKDDFDELVLIGGVDQHASEKGIVSAIVVCEYPSLKVKEQVFAIEKPPIPYVSGFRAFREGPAIGEAYSKLTDKPQIMFFAGNGILHVQKAGLASHMGILLDQPSIGIARRCAIGVQKNDFIVVEGEKRAKSIVTRKFSNPIYVSPGHRVSLLTAVKLTGECIREPHKLPEPLHEAHKLAKKAAKEESGKK